MPSGLPPRWELWRQCVANGYVGVARDLALWVRP